MEITSNSLKKAKLHMVIAKDELVQSAVELGKCGNFESTIKEITETIGDLCIAEKIISDHIDRQAE